MKILIGLVAASALLPAVGHSANMLANGSFETVDPGFKEQFLTISAGEDKLPGWTVDSGSIDHIGNYWQADDGTKSLDMDGNAVGAISQSFATVAGITYQVSFAMAGNPDGGGIKKLQVSADGQSADFTFDSTGKSATNMGWVTNGWSFVADDSTASLAFQSLSSVGSPRGAQRWTMSASQRYRCPLRPCCLVPA